MSYRDRHRMPKCAWFSSYEYVGRRLTTRPSNGRSEPSARPLSARFRRSTRALARHRTDANSERTRRGLDFRFRPTIDGSHQPFGTRCTRRDDARRQSS